MKNRCDPARRALGDIFLARRSELRLVASRMAGRTEWVEDILQDTYLKLIQAERGPPVLNPFGYCCEAVRNTVRDYLRRQAFEATVIEIDFQGDLPEAPLECTVDLQIDLRRQIDRIDLVLRGLSPRSRRVFELCKVRGYSQREAARLVGISATLVNTLLAEVMAAMTGTRDGGV